ncbi:hypothetical protein Syn7502_02644 [Synechococcus sp. PCC 7502]|uniref:hypothetical protein n=1 Tax=Synechococcus sp. PCC 7502 TaxID=1173263 RepID=UPI00029FE31D|nr:hypothetical protein [Synechococcus sp. PCC 7502]AFY74603.1 hypothetical protein Syn7502_02644 [Synechococcus sp. PCC 7502]
MKTTFNYSGSNLFTPTAFLPEFNNFATISATQAWSLFFTASREDTALGSDFGAGQFWTNLLIATVVSSILSIVIFQSL